MIYISHREKRVLEFIREYKTVTERQIKKLIGASNSLLNKIIKNTMIQKQKNTYLDSDIYFLGKQPNLDIALALEVLVHFKEKVKWHLKATPPFCITFFMNDKVFDVAVIKKGEETLVGTAINRTQAERVIAIIESKESIEKIKIEKAVRYCLIDPKKNTINFIPSSE